MIQFWMKLYPAFLAYREPIKSIVCCYESLAGVHAYAADTAAHLYRSRPPSWNGRNSPWIWPYGYVPAMSRLCPRLLDLVAMSRNTAWFYQQVFGTIHKLSTLASIIIILLSRYLVGVVARIWVHSIAQIVECGQWAWSNFCTYYFCGSLLMKFATIV